MATIMMRVTTALFVCCLVSVAAASAADVKIGDTPLHLPQPHGYCEMDPVQATDAAFIAAIHRTIISSGNRLLVLGGDCGELKDWRSGKRKDLDHFNEYQTVLSMENDQLPETPQNAIKNYCANMHTLGDLAMPGTPRDAQARAEQAAKTITFSEPKMLGVVAQDPLACFAIIMDKLKTEGGQGRTRLSMLATTVVKDKVVLYYQFAPYVGRATITQLLAQQRTNVSQLQRANQK
jgi:hypothetical protein